MVMATGCGPASTNTSPETVSIQLQNPVSDAKQNGSVQTTKTNDVSVPVAPPKPEKSIVAEKDSVSVDPPITKVYKNNATEPVSENEEVDENTGQNQENTPIYPVSTATPKASSITQKLTEDTTSDTLVPAAPTEPAVIQPTPAPPLKPAWPEAPDFSLPSAQGSQVELSSYKGDKHTILVFYRAYW